MKRYRKYAPYIILISFLVIFIPRNKPVSLEWLGIVAVIIGIIFLLEFIEKSRDKRIEKWISLRPNKILYMLRYCIFYGLPAALIIGALIYDKATIQNLALFILLPLLLIFGWIGHLEWQKCYEESLLIKYKKA